MEMDYLQNLNEQQIQAVTTTEGPLLVLSGAGTGKTRVLTARIAHILHNNLAKPWQILSLTFTNKAANEMRYRIAQYKEIAHLCGDLWMGTFHSMCLKILRANWSEIGIRRDFLIYGEDDQKSVLKRVITNLGFDTKSYNPSDWVDKIAGYKDKGIWNTDKLVIGEISKKILNAYNAELTRMGALDFGDIILNVLKLFDSNAEILRKYQKQFKYILVDEFQDTNAAQMALLKMLTKDNDNPNICCVGDDDQSIYSWRGAEIKNILEFEKTYKNAKIIRLEINYRSTGNILGAANSLIRHNHERLGKELKVADNVGIGEPVYVLTTPTDWDEAKLVADTIIKNGKNNLSDFVILIRAGSVSRTFEEEFNSRNIPYRIIGATKFYDRMEIRDAIAYTRLLVYPFDDISFERVISKPSRKIGPAAMIKMRELGGSLMDGLRNVKLSVAQRKNADEFLNAFDFDWQNIEPKIAVQKLLEDSGYLNMWRQSKDNDAEERIEHIKELLSIVEKYDSLYDFLEHAALMMTDDNDNEYDDNGVVNIMTIHAAKGLEFDSVFLPAWEEGVFPNDNKYDQDIEEERRLAYVAITRAKKRVIITNAMSRMMFGERKYNSASRFIGEIDKKFIKSYGDYDSMVESSKPVIKKTKTISADVGKMVEHKTLGRGVVIASDEDTLTIAFKTKGVKKVMREFIEFV